LLFGLACPVLSEKIVPLLCVSFVLLPLHCHVLCPPASSAAGACPSSVLLLLLLLSAMGGIKVEFGRRFVFITV